MNETLDIFYKILQKKVIYYNIMLIILHMYMIINKNNISRLVRNAKLTSLIDNTYLHDTSNENFVYIARKFFPWEDYTKIKTLNTWSWLFNTVSSILSNYTWNIDCDYNIDIIQATKDIVTYWFAILWISTFINWKWQIEASVESMDSDWYIVQDWVEMLVKVYEEKDTAWMNVSYLLIQSYYDTYTENKLYRSTLSNVLDFQNLQEVPLDTIQDTTELQEIQPHSFGRPSIYLIRENEKEIYPANSLIEKIKNQVYAIDRKIVMFDCEFLRNVESFVIFKGIELPPTVYEKKQKWYELTIQDFWRYIQGGDNSAIEFVNNDNQLIDKAMASQTDDMRRISQATSIPLDFLWFEVSHWSIGKWSRSLMHWSFIKTIESIRKLRDRYLPMILNDMSKIKDYWDTYSRPDVYSKSDTELLEEITIAKSNKLISHERAIQLYMWYSEDEAQAEVAKINETEVEVVNPLLNSGNQWE